MIMPSDHRKIAVIGGGVSGLATAYYIKKEAEGQTTMDAPIDGGTDIPF